MATGVRYRQCPECGEESAYPLNKYSCCLARGIRSQKQDRISLTAEELRAIIQDEIARAQADLLAASQTSSDVFADGATILLSDIHIPLHHVRATGAVVKFVQSLKASGWLRRLVLAGDIFDGTNLSRFAKSSRDEGHPFDFGQEIAEGAGIIHDLAECFEEAVYFEGNHEQRLKRVLAVGPLIGVPEEPLEIENLFNFYGYPANLVVHKQRKLSIGRGDEGTVDIIHGEKYNKHRAAGLLEDNLYRNTVQGHTHRPQTFWTRGRFGHVNGYLHDPRRQNYDPDPAWTLGFTILEHWDNGTKVNPHFVRITPDGSFAWNGKVYRG